MNRQIPEYLRLHVEDLAVPTTAAADEPQKALDRLCECFHQATGWRLRHGEGAAPLQSPDVLWARTLSPAATCPSHLAIHRSPGKSAHDLQNELLPLCDLVDSMAELISSQHDTQQALIQREAELALGVPLVSHPDEDSHLSELLEAILQGGAEAIDVQAAGLYLLDDATSSLKLRARWGLPDLRFLESARELRGAFADLEALTGNAVAIEDTSLLPHWKVPESCSSALCVPVATSTTPLGTLWFFSTIVRDFTPLQTNLAEIVAGRLAVELERQILLGEVSQQRSSETRGIGLHDLHDALLPIGPVASDTWEVAALAHQGRDGASEFYDWTMHADGTLSVALAGIRGEGLGAALTLQTLRGATKALMLQEASPGQIIRNAADVMWTSSTGEHQASLMAMQLPNSDAVIEFCSGGPSGALIVRESRPTAIGQGAPMLGNDPDAYYHEAAHAVQSGEVVVLVSDALRKAVNADGEQLGEAAIAECVSENLECDTERLAHTIFDLWREYTADPRQAVSIVVAKRCT